MSWWRKDPPEKRADDFAQLALASGD